MMVGWFGGLVWGKGSCLQTAVGSRVVRGGCGCNAAGGTQRAGESQQLDGAGGECQRKMRVFALDIRIEVRAKYSEHSTLIDSTAPTAHSTRNIPDRSCQRELIAGCDSLGNTC